ncbi:energy transducer TonB [Blastomonas sp. SL216]|uniref:energy transducer TonB n=1 Tax=Blastomonas sp. SL216 TaxID=2995169 RepID=UPI002376F2A9|nr:energy transducer TonB [Blastomonas sp. SL216]
MIFLVLAGLTGHQAEKIPELDLRVRPEHFENAIPINPEKWITSKDYPEGIVQRSDSGIVSVSLEINRSGRISDCKVTSYSGCSVLDNIPCRLLERRARFFIPNDMTPASARMTFYFPEPKMELR